MIWLIKVFGPLLVLILGLISLALQERWWHLQDGRTKRHKYVVWLLVGLMIFAAVVNVYVAWSDHKDSVERASKIDTLLAANQALSSQVDLKTNQIVVLSEANARLSQSISDSITGGSSYCWFFSGFPSESLRAGNSVLSLLMYEGQHPLRDLRIQIWNLDPSKKGPREIHRPTFFLPKNGLGESVAEWVQLPVNADWQSFDIIYSAVNGSWHERVTFRRVNEKWQTAMSVTKDDGKIILRKQVDPNFPRDDTGKILW